MRENIKKEYILGVGITEEDEDKILEFIIRSLDNGLKEPARRQAGLFIVTPNPEMVVYASKHNGFKKILNEADIAIPDGIGIIWAAKLLGKTIRKRITGVDIIEKLCGDFAKRHKTIGFLGGRGNVAEKTAECLVRKYPGLRVGFAASEWPDGKVKSIDFLFVAFGFPKQEEWIYKNLDRLSVKAAMGVGGAFDFISGKVVRAPKIIRALGLEWFFRLIIEPWRIKRQIALVKFAWLIIIEYIKFIKKRVKPVNLP